MTICRRTVMNTAWTDYRSITAEITYARHQLRSVFATCLKCRATNKLRVLRQSG